MEKKDIPHYHGHRQRLRQKLLEHGAQSLEDYEILELVLMTALPRRDVKPLAKDLINQFGSLAKVIHAPKEDLLKISGIKDNTLALFKIIEGAIQRSLKNEVMQQEIISGWERLLDYCKIHMGHLKKEEFHILFLDAKNKLIKDEVQQKGTISHTPIYPREVVTRTLELHASAIIMVHNHPSGDPTPSKVDIEMTEKVKEALEIINVNLHDHLIITKDKNCSFKALGLL